MKLNIAISAVLLALPFAAYADDAASGRAAQFRAQLESRFTAADTNGDGQLSQDEAKAGMPGVARNFDAIDADHNGYVTRDEIMSAVQAGIMARRAGPTGQ